MKALTNERKARNSVQTFGPIMIMIIIFLVGQH